jgi:Lon protease-like protein
MVSSKKTASRIDFMDRLSSFQEMDSVNIPDTIPAMVLDNTVFFPNSVLPLFIFEDKYRKMLDAVIHGDRMFTVIQKLPSSDSSNPPEITATLGCLKACQTHADGTSTVLLEGVCRVRIVDYLEGQPYPVLKIAKESQNQADAAKLTMLRAQTISLLEEINGCSTIIDDNLLEHFKEINPPQLFVDHVTASIIENSALKHRILNCPDPYERFASLIRRLQHRLYQIQVLREVLGNPPKESIERN